MNKENREQKKMMMQMQQQMQMMLSGKALDKMTPEQLQQMMLHGGALNAHQLPQPATPMISQVPQPQVLSVVPAATAQPTSVHATDHLSQEVEKLIRDAYRACFTPGQADASQAANSELLKSLIHQFRVSPDKQRALQKQALAEMGGKPTA